MHSYLLTIFPGNTVMGTPKVRCWYLVTEIFVSLETRPEYQSDTTSFNIDSDCTEDIVQWAIRGKCLTDLEQLSDIWPNLLSRIARETKVLYYVCTTFVVLQVMELMLASVSLFCEYRPTNLSLVSCLTDTGMFSPVCCRRSHGNSWVSGLQYSRPSVRFLMIQHGSLD